MFVLSSNSNKDCEQTISFNLTEKTSKVKNLCKYNPDRSICEIPIDAYRNLFVANTAVSEMYNKVPIRFELNYSCTNEIGKCKQINLLGRPKVN